MLKGTRLWYIIIAMKSFEVTRTIWLRSQILCGTKLIGEGPIVYIIIASNISKYMY